MVICSTAQEIPDVPNFLALYVFRYFVTCSILPARAPAAARLIFEIEDALHQKRDLNSTGRFPFGDED